MNRAEVEALMFRWQALYPASARTDRIEAALRLEEWLATPEIIECPVELATAVFDEWKVANDWPPTLHQFVERMAAIRHRRRRTELEQTQQELLAEYDESIVPPEEAKQYIAAIRGTLEEWRRRNRAALDGEPV